MDLTNPNQSSDLPGSQAGKAIMDNLDALAKFSVDLQYAHQDGLWIPYGTAGYTKSIRDGIYHFSYLAESLAANEPGLFLDYIAWARVLFSGLKLPSGALVSALDCMNQAVHETLQPETALLAQSTLNAALDQLTHDPEALPSFILPDAPLGDLAARYLDTSLRGERYSASQLIMEAATQGASVRDIYLYIFQPCQQEIGRLWQMNQINVAQEHFCSSVTQMVMSQLAPYIFSGKRNGHRLVAASVGGELHEIGMRMVADFLEMEGWDTHYLGANTPDESILSVLEERQAEVLAVSVTLPLHVSKVARLIGSIRLAGNLSKLKVLVGGYPFNISADLWRQVGADGYARSAQDAVEAALHLVEGE